MIWYCLKNPFYPGDVCNLHLRLTTKPLHLWVFQPLTYIMPHPPTFAFEQYDHPQRDARIICKWEGRNIYVLFWRIFLLHIFKIFHLWNRESCEESLIRLLWNETKFFQQNVTDVISISCSFTNAHSADIYHHRSQTLKSDEAKWPKMIKMTPTSSFLRGYTHDLDKNRRGDRLVCLSSSYGYIYDISNWC